MQQRKRYHRNSQTQEAVTRPLWRLINTKQVMTKQDEVEHTITLRPLHIFNLRIHFPCHLVCMQFSDINVN